MALTGEYEPSTFDFSRDQVDRYERSGGTEDYNLTANPHVALQDGPVENDYQAREVQGEEYVVWFEQAVAAWPGYAEYQKKTTRTIPIFVLTPLDA